MSPSFGAYRFCTLVSNPLVLLQLFDGDPCGIVLIQHSENDMLLRCGSKFTLNFACCLDFRG